jgi:hypothetical protein
MQKSTSIGRGRFQGASVGRNRGKLVQSSESKTVRYMDYKFAKFEFFYCISISFIYITP